MIFQTIEDYMIDEGTSELNTTMHNMTIEQALREAEESEYGMKFVIDSINTVGTSTIVYFHEEFDSSIIGCFICKPYIKH